MHGSFSFRAGIVICGLTLAATVFAQQSTLTLKVTSSQPSADGKTVQITLASGATISVPAADVESPPTPVATAAAGAPVIDTSIIRPKCAKEWPDDFSVRAYCEKTQNEAVAKLKARSMTTPDERTIRTKCAKEWPDDYTVRNYCEETQLKALKIVK